MTDNDHTVARALNNPTFIWYLNRFITNAVSWKDIADKCLGQTNDYCLSLIKSKCWTDKSVEGGAWNERLESLIHERLTLAVNYISLMRKKDAGQLPAVILKIDPSKVSQFIVRSLELIDQYITDLLMFYDIPYRFMTADDLKGLDYDCIYFNYNRITWHCGPVPFKRGCNTYISSDTPFTPMCDYMTDIDCINAGIMIWEFLLNDEFSYPNCTVLRAREEHLEKSYLFVDHAQSG